MVGFVQLNELVAVAEQKIGAQRAGRLRGQHLLISIESQEKVPERSECVAAKSIP
jgi:hypothetical protein